MNLFYETIKNTDFWAMIGALGGWASAFGTIYVAYIAINKKPKLKIEDFEFFDDEIKPDLRPFFDNVLYEKKAYVQFRVANISDITTSIYDIHITYKCCIFSDIKYIERGNRNIILDLNCQLTKYNKINETRVSIVDCSIYANKTNYILINFNLDELIQYPYIINKLKLIITYAGNRRKINLKLNKKHINKLKEIIKCYA